MDDSLLLQLANNLRDAKAQRAKLADLITLLGEMGQTTGTYLTDLHNIDIKIAKQTEVLRKRGYTVE